MALPQFTWVPDNTTTGQTDFRVIENQYNDGYKQRAKDGINTRKAIWTLIWGVLETDEAEAIAAWLEDPAGGNAGGSTFQFVPAIAPWKGIPQNVTCKTWSWVYDGPIIVGITAQFEQSFTPA